MQAIHYHMCTEKINVYHIDGTKLYMGRAIMTKHRLCVSRTLEVRGVLNYSFVMCSHDGVDKGNMCTNAEYAYGGALCAPKVPKHNFPRNNSGKKSFLFSGPLRPPAFRRGRKSRGRWRSSTPTTPSSAGGSSDGRERGSSSEIN